MARKIRELETLVAKAVPLADARMGRVSHHSAPPDPGIHHLRMAVHGLRGLLHEAEVECSRARIHYEDDARLVGRAEAFEMAVAAAEEELKLAEEETK